MKERELPELQRKVVEQQVARRHWRDETALDVGKNIVEESKELLEAMEIDKPAIEIASEMGDVFYLLLKLADQTGIDLRDALEMKILRNSLKYPDALQSDGMTPDEARKASKHLWTHMGGDQKFYEWYAEHVGPEGVIVFDASHESQPLPEQPDLEPDDLI